MIFVSRILLFVSEFIETELYEIFDDRKTRDKIDSVVDLVCKPIDYFESKKWLKNGWNK